MINSYLLNLISSINFFSPEKNFIKFSLLEFGIHSPRVKRQYYPCEMTRFAVLCNCNERTQKLELELTKIYCRPVFFFVSQRSEMAMAVEGGGTLSEIHQSSKKLLMKARDGVEKLERLESSTSTGGYDSPELSFAVKKDIAQIQSLCVEMDRLWRSVSVKSQRDLWKR